MQIHVNKIEIRITFKVKNGYILELLTPETMKLLGSNENKITKDKNGEKFSATSGNYGSSTSSL